MGLLRRKQRQSDRSPTPSGGNLANSGLFSRIFGRKPAKTSQTAREHARKRRSVRLDAANGDSQAVNVDALRSLSADDAGISDPVIPADPAPSSGTFGRADRSSARASMLPTPAPNGSVRSSRQSVSATLSPPAPEKGGLLGFVRKKSSMSLRSKSKSDHHEYRNANGDASTSSTLPSGRSPLYEKMTARPVTAIETTAANGVDTASPVESRAKGSGARGIGRSNTTRAPPTSRPGLLAATADVAAEKPRIALADAPPPLPPKSHTNGWSGTADLATGLLTPELHSSLGSPSPNPYDIPLSPQDSQDDNSVFRSTSPPPRAASALDTLEMSRPLSFSPVFGTPKGASLARGRSISGPGKSVNSAVTTVTTAGSDTLYSPLPADAMSISTSSSASVSPVGTPVLRSAGETMQAGTRHPVPRKSVVPARGRRGSSEPPEVPQLPQLPLAATPERAEIGKRLGDDPQLPDSPISPGIVIPAPVEPTLGYIPSPPLSPQEAMIGTRVGAVTVATVGTMAASGAGAGAAACESEVANEPEPAVVMTNAGNGDAPKSGWSAIEPEPIETASAENAEVLVATGETPTLDSEEDYDVENEASVVSRETPTLSLPFDSRPLSFINLDTTSGSQTLHVNTLAPPAEEEGEAEVEDVKVDTVPGPLIETTTVFQPTLDGESPVLMVSPSDIPSSSPITPTVGATAIQQAASDEEVSSPNNGESITTAVENGTGHASAAPLSPPTVASVPLMDDSETPSVTENKTHSTTAVSTPTIPLDTYIPDPIGSVDLTEFKEMNAKELENPVTIENRGTKSDVVSIKDEDAALAVETMSSTSTDEVAADEAIVTTTSVLPSIKVPERYDTISDDGDDDGDTPPLSPTDEPIVTAAFKAATALQPVPAVPPKDVPLNLGKLQPNGANAATPRTPSVGTATVALAAMASADTSPASMSPATPPAIPMKTDILGNHLQKSLGVRSSTLATPSPSPQRTNTLTPHREGFDSLPRTPRTPSSFKAPKSPRTPNPPSTPGTPGSTASDVTLDDFMGLFKTVIGRDKGMSIRDAAKLAEHRNVA